MCNGAQAARVHSRTLNLIQNFIWSVLLAPAELLEKICAASLGVCIAANFYM